MLVLHSGLDHLFRFHSHINIKAHLVIAALKGLHNNDFLQNRMQTLLLFGSFFNLIMVTVSWFPYDNDDMQLSV